MRRIVAVAITILLAAGCGETGGKGTLSGKLTYKGRPVNGATLYLYPGGGEALLVPVAQDGTFRVSDVPPGEYKVVARGSAGAAGPSLKGVPPDKLEEAKAKVANMRQDATIPFPDKYKVKETSPLTVTVKKGKTEQDLALTD